jgi:hypothetical protein
MQWLEKVWHDHFASKRKIGSGKRRASEWFELNDADVHLFKQHREWNNPAFNSPSQLSLFEEEWEQKPKPHIGNLSHVLRQPMPPLPTPKSLDALDSVQSGSKADAVERVTVYFDRKIAAHPNRAAKLTQARNWQIAEIESQMHQWRARGYTEAQALAKWEEFACKSADAKLK